MARICILYGVAIQYVVSKQFHVGEVVVYVQDGPQGA
jgi:hypothetical protein